MARFHKGSAVGLYRPDFLYLATTSAELCTGDGSMRGEAIGAECVGSEVMQAHSTGLVCLMSTADLLKGGTSLLSLPNVVCIMSGAGVDWPI